MDNFATLSLETHLFFARIMREHALFLEAGFPCKDEEWIKKADFFRKEFEDLLRETVRISSGRVGRCILESDELVTEFTIPAEKCTSDLSGVPIDSRISMAEKELRSGRFMGTARENDREMDREVHRVIDRINERAIWLLDGLIEFKEAILREVSEAKLFTANYPLLIKHIIREAKLYRATVEQLMRGQNVSRRDLLGTEDFWNQIMMEHALFIRGLLDPSEEQLIETANGFAEDYARLLDMAKRQDLRAETELRRRSLDETLKYREFKAAGAEGILNCTVASIILPLLADHVLREANHYIRILGCS